MNHSARDIVIPAQTQLAAPATRPVTLWLDYTLTGCLVLLVCAAPHSIAVTQIAWGVGLFVWVVRCALRPRPRLQRTPIDYALLGFFILTFISALCSYDVDVSIGKLRAASLFTIVYLVAQHVHTRRRLRLLTLLLVVSCMVNVGYTFVKYARGRGVKLNRLTVDSPLRRFNLLEGDTLLTADGRPLRSTGALARALAGPPAAPTVHITFYRREWVSDVIIPRGVLLQGNTASAQLGLMNWSLGRDERATGFYGFYVTYAEVLQLIGSLAVGLFIALRRKWSRTGVLLALAFVGMSVALLMTVTRASWGAFLVSVGVMLLAGAASKRAILLVALGALLAVPVGLYVLRQKRQVGFLDQGDGSITWRETVYREGFNLLVSRPRHLLVGIGMDTIKRHWRAWGMFDHGRLPWGHMHSTPLQIALERGLPTLAAWLALLFIYLRMLWRLVRSPQVTDWIERGLALGALGGTCGFFTTGLVHYNLGDSEVVMVFYLIMGLALVVERFAREKPRVETT